MVHNRLEYVYNILVGLRELTDIVGTNIHYGFSAETDDLDEFIVFSVPRIQPREQKAGVTSYDMDFQVGVITNNVTQLNAIEEILVNGIYNQEFPNPALGIQPYGPIPVSYTHLTLPTIYSV